MKQKKLTRGTARPTLDGDECVAGDRSASADRYWRTEVRSVRTDCCTPSPGRHRPRRISAEPRFSTTKKAGMAAVAVAVASGGAAGIERETGSRRQTPPPPTEYGSETRRVAPASSSYFRRCLQRETGQLKEKILESHLI